MHIKNWSVYYPDKRIARLAPAIETVELFHQHWNEEKKNLPLYPDVISTIEDHLKTVPIYT
jgi:hypothetical protein